MDNSKYCADLQGGMWLKYQTAKRKWMAKPCCLYGTEYEVTSNIQDEFWLNDNLQKERIENLKGHELPDNCSACRRVENNGNYSRRQSWNDRLGTHWQNPQSVIELDLQVDFSCNLACRICGPELSTFWRHVETKDKFESSKKFKVRATDSNIVDLLSTVPTHDIKQIHFQGGEPLLSLTHLRVLEKLQDTVDLSQISLWYHSNATTRVSDTVLKFWEKFKMLEIYFSLDDLGPRMEYQRWPANWKEMTDNLEWFRTNLPHNGLLRVERTVGVLTAAWITQFDQWQQDNFSETIYGDKITINYHDCMGEYSFAAMSSEYKEHALLSVPPGHWVHNRILNAPTDQESAIRKMLDHLNTHDQIRNQNWRDTYPEFLTWYKRYL